jgi:hypothetical protein
MCKPVGKKLDVFAPVSKTHFFEDACAFANTAIIVAEYLNMLCSQKSRPSNPRVVRKVPLSGKWPYKQKACYWIGHRVKHRVKVCARGCKIPWLLWWVNF